MRRFTSRYGAGPVHLVALLAGGALSAYAVTRVTSLGTLVAIGLWFAGTLVAHDLVLFPIYATTDHLGARIAHRATGSARIPWINHVRVPAFLSGLLLLVWFPLVLRLSPGYEHASGRSQDGYLVRWLLVTAVLFAVSAAVYAVRVARRPRRN